MDKNKKENLLILGLSFLIALYIWGYVTNLRNPIQTKTFNNVPISLLNIDSLEAQNLSIDSTSLPTATVVLEGRFSELQSFDASLIDASIELENFALKEGTNVVMVDVTIDNDAISIVKEKTTMKVELEAEKSIKKEISVVVQTNGTPASDYIALDGVPSKTKVIVSGSKIDIDELKYLLATVDIQDSTNDVTSTVQLKAINKYGEESKNVILKDMELDVVVPVKYTKTVPIEISVVGEPSYNYSLVSKESKIKNITIYGDKDVLDTISSIKTEDISLSRRYYDFDKLVSLVFPEGVYPKDPNNTSVYASFVIEQN